MLLSKGSQEARATPRDLDDALFGSSAIKRQDISIIESNWEILRRNYSHHTWSSDHEERERSCRKTSGSDGMADTYGMVGLMGANEMT